MNAFASIPTYTMMRYQYICGQWMFGTCMSLSRMTSPCRLIRLTIIIIFLISTHALNNNKVGCDDVYSFCESQTSYKYITCMSLIAALTIWIFIFVFRTLRTFLICAVSLPHHNLLTFQVQVFTLNCYKSSTFLYKRTWQFIHQYWIFFPHQCTVFKFLLLKILFAFFLQW